MGQSAASSLKVGRFEAAIVPIRSSIPQAIRSPQIHRLQASKSRGGVILVPKSGVADVIKAQPLAPSVTVMPATDVSVYGPLASKIQGPFEIVLEDTKLKTSHKRLIQFLVIDGDVKFTLAKPTCSFTTPLVAELVLELDSRCTRQVTACRNPAIPVDQLQGESSGSFWLQAARRGSVLWLSHCTQSTWR